MILRRFAVLLAFCSAAHLCAQTPITFRYFYDDANELVGVLDSTGILIQYVYDPAGNIVQINRSTVSPTVPMILNVTPLSGSWGQTLTITGQNFSSVAANNVVQINGLTVTVISATTTQIVILLPPNATQGQITVTVNGTTVSSGPNLIFTPISLPTNYVAAKLLSVQNGTVPGTIPAAGQNETPFRVFSVLNMSTSLPTGQNEAVFKIFSVLNGATPGSTLPTGTNEAPFRTFSVLNGSLPGSTLQTGQNESVFPIFSVGNSSANAFQTTISAQAARAASAPVPVRTHVVLPAGVARAGQTVRIAADLENAGPGSTVEFRINGEGFGVYTAPYEIPLTVPYSVGSLLVTAVARDANHNQVGSDEGSVAVATDARLSLRGRAVERDGAPVVGRTLTLEASGLRAELFHFPAPLREMPVLEGLKPAAVRFVSGLNLRNPAGVFGGDPLGAGLAPDFAVRFTGSLAVAEEGDYGFSLRGMEGVALRVGGRAVTDGGKVHLAAGTAAFEALAFVGAGPLEVQLLWQPPGQTMQPVADGFLWTRDAAATAVTGPGGEFEFDGVPGAAGSVRVVGAEMDSGPVAATVGDIGVLTARKAGVR
jgi:YD repeat-containing protein